MITSVSVRPAGRFVDVDCWCGEQHLDVDWPRYAKEVELPCGQTESTQEDWLKDTPLDYNPRQRRLRGNVVAEQKSKSSPNYVGGSLSQAELDGVVVSANENRVVSANENRLGRTRIRTRSGKVVAGKGELTSE